MIQNIEYSLSTIPLENDPAWTQFSMKVTKQERHFLRFTSTSFGERLQDDLHDDRKNETL